MVRRSPESLPGRGEHSSMHTPASRTVNRAYANQAGAVFSNLWDGKVRMGLQASTLWQNFWGVGTVLKRKKCGRTEQESRLTK
jgi:hypothetical protein